MVTWTYAYEYDADEEGLAETVAEAASWVPEDDEIDRDYARAWVTIIDADGRRRHRQLRELSDRTNKTGGLWGFPALFDTMQRCATHWEDWDLKWSENGYRAAPRRLTHYAERNSSRRFA